MEAVLIIGKNVTLKEYDLKDAYVVGIDQGAILALEEGIALDAAIGDFDSIEKEEEKRLSKQKNVFFLNREKDDTDTAAALKILPKEVRKITILGGIQGNRIDHFLANLLLMEQDERIGMVDDDTMIFIKNESFQVSKGKYHYLSLFALEEVVDLTLNGVAYPLTNYTLFPKDPLCISNEWKTDLADITFQSGKLLVILSKEDRRNNFK
ncbi:MAG TPA: thiamine diphosphokinase [Candidatus Pelethenecus faecipullorum]|uniref:Thiamine diphosphokinase n=1 Tax=Candidatus Pelethenecus faecipullorum TaxID=2840900 RepID=A0A9D1GQV1_9MOLU|nr:thiamine diphosphokinase [Candidatus Pelethenecus faecipullorum]